MKENAQNIPNIEMRKNLAAGAIFGCLLGIAFGVVFGSLLLGIPVGILLGLAVGYRISRAPIKMRYPMHIMRRILLVGSFCFISVVGYGFALDHGWTGRPAILAAVLVILIWGWMVVVLASAIASLDELQRRIQTEAIAIGFAGTAIVVGGVGLLSLSGMVSLNWGLVLGVMVVMWLVGKLWTMWKYR